MIHPARAAWRRGDVEGAARRAEGTDHRTTFLTSYVKGRYEHTLEFPGPKRLTVQALLHLGRPEDAVRLLRRVPPALRLRADHPLRTDLARPTAVPFADHALAPYLTAVDVRLDGHDLAAVLDTGGGFVVMGTERAEELGIPLVVTGVRYQGTTRTRTFAGLARELTIGDAVLGNVPVAALSTLRGAQDVVIVGSNVFQQFRTTIDHPGRRLILEPRRTPPPEETAVARMPFHLWDDHYLFARGGFAGRTGLNFFLDSGFACVIDDDAGPRQAVLYVAERRRRSRVSHLDTDEPISLGPLRRRGPHLVATAPGRRTPWHSVGGVRIDGLLSGAFFHSYAWTLDFDLHGLTFRETSQKSPNPHKGE